jgi:hypothetical protein
MHVFPGVDVSALFSGDNEDTGMIGGTKELYREFLENLSTKQGRWYRSELTCFISLKGREFYKRRELLVVGRAVNGWLCSDQAENWKAPEKRDEFIEKIFKDKTPITWVSEQWGSAEKYNTKRSAFWRVARELVRKLEIADIGNNDWPSHIAWSNLYKVAPAAGGNPSETLKEAEFQYCTKILSTEIMELKPRRIAFLTGLKWAEQFLGALGADPSGRYANCRLEASGRLSSESNFVVLPHPQGKPESEIVDAAVHGFARLSQ